MWRTDELVWTVNHSVQGGPSRNRFGDFSKPPTPAHARSIGVSPAHLVQEASKAETIRSRRILNPRLAIKDKHCTVSYYPHVYPIPQFVWQATLHITHAALNPKASYLQLCSTRNLAYHAHSTKPESILPLNIYDKEPCTSRTQHQTRKHPTPQYVWQATWHATHTAPTTLLWSILPLFPRQATFHITHSTLASQPLTYGVCDLAKFCWAGKHTNIMKPMRLPRLKANPTQEKLG